MHRDLLQQAFGAMRHDLRKTLLTMLGMAWGIATVVLLLAYGEGFGRAINNIFQSFGAKAVGIFPGRTTLEAGGNKAGVEIRFTNDDINLLQNVVPLIRHISRGSDKQSTVVNGNRSFTLPVSAVDPPVGAIWNLDIDQGRFLNDEDNLAHRRVVVLGYEAKNKLFSGMDPYGKDIRIDGVTFQVVGVVAARMQEGDNDINRQLYIPFNVMSALQDTHYLGGIWLDYEGLDHDKVTKTIRTSLGMAHNFKPEDLRAVHVFDAQKQLAQFNIITHGVKSPAGFYWDDHAGDRRHRADEHHAGLGDAAHPRNWRGEGSGRTEAGHFVSVPCGSDGDHRGGRDFRDSDFLSHLVFGRLADPL